MIAGTTDIRLPPVIGSSRQAQGRRLAGAPVGGGGGDGPVTWPGDRPPGPQPAKAEAYRILLSRTALTRLPKHSRDVTERVIYASADFDYATDLVCDEEALAGAVTALAAGRPVRVHAGP